MVAILLANGRRLILDVERLGARRVHEVDRPLEGGLLGIDHRQVVLTAEAVLALGQQLQATVETLGVRLQILQPARGMLYGQRRVLRAEVSGHGPVKAAAVTLVVAGIDGDKRRHIVIRQADKLGRNAADGRML